MTRAEGFVIFIRTHTGGTLRIPPGQIVSTARTLRREGNVPVYYFETQEPGIIIDGDQTSFRIRARACDYGSISNVRAQMILEHVDADRDTFPDRLLVVNPSPMTGGSDTGGESGPRPTPSLARELEAMEEERESMSMEVAEQRAMRGRNERIQPGVPRPVLRQRTDRTGRAWNAVDLAADSNARLQAEAQDQLEVHFPDPPSRWEPHRLRMNVTVEDFEGARAADRDEAVGVMDYWEM